MVKEGEKKEAAFEAKTSTSIHYSRFANEILNAGQAAVEIILGMHSWDEWQ